jgi:uncharacterized SAM-binding protein YcdF (DUF218 family)
MNHDPMIAGELKSSPHSGSAVAPSSGKPRPKAHLSRGTKVFLGSLVVASVLFFARHPLMTLAAKVWIVNDPLVKSDAVVVLGGGLESRPSFAADLYRRGLVTMVLVADVRSSPAVDKGVLPSETAIAIGLLEKEGVPSSAIETFGSKVSSTRDESVGVHAWVAQHPSHRLIIPSDPFHTRRVKWLFTRALKDQRVEVSVASIPAPRYDPLAWWHSEEATIDFQNEIVKFLYYWLHY